MHKIIVKMLILACFVITPPSVYAQNLNIQTAPIPLSQIMNTSYYEQPEIQNYSSQDVFMPNTYDDTVIPQKTLKGRVYTVPAGSSFSAKMQSSLSSKSMKQGDQIAAILDKDWIHNNQIIAPAGSILYGEVKKNEQSGRAMKNGKIELKFTEVETPNGDTIELSANTYVVKVDQNRTWEITKNVAGKTATGAATGLGVSVMTNSSSWERTGKIVGVAAAIGLVWGIVDTFSSHEGQDVELPTNTPLTVRLVEPTNVDMAIINQEYL